MIASVVAYDWMDGAWVILPLAWSIERVCNGFWHVWWAVHFREYSPGLVTSILIWMNFYFILRYRPPDQQLTTHEVVSALAIGMAAAAFLSFYIPIVKGREIRSKPEFPGGIR